MNFDLTNQRIEHRYQVTRVIGAGGMATVFEAVDQNLGKRVAVKVLNPPFWGDPIQVARFQREARAIARIRHPNLVDVTHHGITDEGMPFLVMELLEGWDLLIELRRIGGAMPWRRSLALAIQVCGALGAAHDAGVVHRDIKPSNCFLVRVREGGERVKLLDLGIARVVAAADDEDEVPLTQAAGGVPGTLHYMSPEQIRGEPVDPRSDIYSLGVVLYRMLTGVLPFVAGNDAAYELMRMHCEDTPRRPSEVAPAAGIPPAFEEAVLKALAKAPGDRWASAQAFAEALRAVEAESSAALVAPLQGGARPAVGRRRLGLWVGGGALAAGLVGLALLGAGDGGAVASVAGERAKRVSLAVAAAASSAPPQALAEALPELPAADRPPDAGAQERGDDDGEDHAGHDHGAKEAPEVKPAKEPAKEPAKKIRRPKKAPPPDPRVESLLRELENHRGKFRHCRDLIPPGQGYTFAFDVTLKPVSGYVSAVTPVEGDASKMASCMSAVLAKLHFHGVPEGGTIRGLRFAL